MFHIIYNTIHLQWLQKSIYFSSCSFLCCWYSNKEVSYFTFGFTYIFFLFLPTKLSLLFLFVCQADWEIGSIQQMYVCVCVGVFVFVKGIRSVWMFVFFSVSLKQYSSNESLHFASEMFFFVYLLTTVCVFVCVCVGPYV